MKFAVIETGGKQYLVKPGDKIKIERIKAGEGLSRKATAEGGAVHFDKVLLIAGEGETKIGDPYIKGGKISGKLLREGRNKKITHLRYHSKTRYTKKSGHRQIFNEVQIGEF